MKRKCLFIDHAYHRKTKSTVFLREQLAEAYEVTDFWLEDYREERLQAMLDTPADLYLVFQQDFLVRFLTSNGRKVLSVPMYDGTGEIGPEHWLTQTDALVLNHSITLHRVVSAMGLDSIEQRFYPEAPALERPVGPEDPAEGPAVFFWERTPSHGLDVRWLASRLQGQHVPYVHLHLSPDPGQYASVSPELAAHLFPDSQVVTSAWFETRAEYQAAMRRCNVFICPRAYEGIGFGFIEALTLGMTVIGLDHPTLNEYVSSGVNGVLLESLSAPFPELTLELLQQTGQQARADAIAGRQRWLDGRAEILRRILAYQSAPVPPRAPMSAAQAAEVCNAFFNGVYAYINHLVDTASLSASAYVPRRSLKRWLAWRAHHLTRNHPTLHALLKATAARLRRR